MIRAMDRQERAELVSRLRRDARLIADHFGLEYRDIAAEDPRVRAQVVVNGVESDGADNEEWRRHGSS